jgi:hypothetical protein
MPPDRNLLKVLKNEPGASREYTPHLGNLETSVKCDGIVNDPANWYSSDAEPIVSAASTVFSAATLDSVSTSLTELTRSDGVTVIARLQLVDGSFAQICTTTVFRHHIGENVSDTSSESC